MARMSTDRRAFQIGVYEDVEDRVAFQRGRFKLSFWQDRTEPIGYEVREYHDVVEVRAFRAHADGRIAGADVTATTFVMRDATFDVLGTLFDEVASGLERHIGVS